MWINANLASLTAQDSIVLANNRQVLAFKKTWGLKRGTSVLPQTFSWKQYLQHTWKEINPNSSKRLISAIESRTLIAQSMTRLGQVVDTRLLDEVVKNIDYCHAHLINDTQLLDSHHQNCELFSAWMLGYQQTKLELDVLDVNDLSKLILNRDREISQPYLYGFKTLTPEQSLLFVNVGHQILSANQPNSHSSNQIFNTTFDEIFHVANWAKDLHSKHPEKHIAIVSPQLNSEHHQIKSIFDQVFDDVLIGTGQKAYNISLGLPLTDYPFIRHLLWVLQLSQQLQSNCISIETFNAVITSPYIAHAQAERSSRALLANQVLSWSQAHFKLNQLNPHLTRTPLLEMLINGISSKVSSGQQKHDQWLLNFNTHLQIWGFATDRTLSSVEYQLFNKYQQTSLGLNQLAQITDKVVASQAIADLQTWLSQVIFQAQSAKTPIQILGSLEAEGLYFDEAWVLGMTDDFLPAALNAPRFIPNDIAARHQIPHSNFELVTKDAQDTLNNLINLSDQVNFSYAKTHFENEQHGSPLLSFNNEIETPEHQDHPALFETINDTQATPLANKQVSGGVGILKDQMACAFKGFAHRLNIKKFDAPHLGLNRAEQGDVVHKVLESIYQQAQSSADLVAYSKDALNQLIDTAIQHELKRYQRSGFAQIERDRLQQLIHKFIATEKQRDAFRVIATEQTIEANVAGLHFSTRLDRVDEMDNGDRIIFDYKTGNLPSNPWCGDPIKEPQLPIYATTNLADGIAFIKPAADKISYTGLARDKDSLPKKTSQQKSCTDWDEQLKLWQQQLDQTSLDYQQGNAEVLPTKGACEYCEYDSLCRVIK
jgi:probable DNA repair protein